MSWTDVVKSAISPLVSLEEDKPPEENAPVASVAPSPPHSAYHDPRTDVYQPAVVVFPQERLSSQADDKAVADMVTQLKSKVVGLGPVRDFSTLEQAMVAALPDANLRARAALAAYTAQGHTALDLIGSLKGIQRNLKTESDNFNVVFEKTKSDKLGGINATLDSMAKDIGRMESDLALAQSRREALTRELKDTQTKFDSIQDTFKRALAEVQSEFVAVDATVRSATGGK